MSSSFSSLHRDIIESHILPKVDGATLALASSSSSSLHHLCSQDYLWLKACTASWPSTTNPLLTQLISKFTNGGPRAFFAQSYPLPPSHPTPSISTPPPPKLISAVDIHYKRNIIFFKVQETETETEWFRCSPFRIDLLEQKDLVNTHIKHPDNDDKSKSLMDDMSLSWIIIDPIQRLAVNMSSHVAVEVNRHWLSGEVKVEFVTIQEGPASVYVQCKVVVTCCGSSEGGELHVREVALELEDMEGDHMYGKDSLVILQRALEGKRGKGDLKGKEARRKYREFLVMKERRHEKMMKREEALDVFCVGFGVSILVVFLWFIFCR